LQHFAHAHSRGRTKAMKLGAVLQRVVDGGRGCILREASDKLAAQPAPPLTRCDYE
jgi:hypothetical protein